MLQRFIRNNRGVAALELVLLAPIFLIMVISGFEVGRYVMIMNKLQSAGFTLSNIVAQTWPATVLNACDTSRLSEETLRNITAGMPTLMEPFSGDQTDLKVIVSSLQKVGAAGGGSLNMAWQQESGELGEYTSEIEGAAGAAAVISDGAVSGQLIAGLDNTENVLVLEAFYRYRPIFPAIFGQISDTFTERTIAKRVYFYNRLGKAIYLPPTYPVVGEIACGS